MIDGALELYKQLSSYARMKEMVDNGETESLHLECKAPIEPRLTKDVQSHLAKALSGFSNTAGGIVIWGVSTTKHSHSGLDVMTQIEPIGNIDHFEKQIHSRIPSLTTPPISGYLTKVIKRRKADTKGLIIAYIPKIESDPIQSARDNHFYYRTGDDFTLAPYEIIKRLFAATESPDVYGRLYVGMSKKLQDGAWEIPIGVENRSSAVAENVMLYVEILNPDACQHIRATSLSDVSNINPGKKIYTTDFNKAIHRGLNIMGGNIILKMHEGKTAKKKVEISIAIYANKMRAKVCRATVHITKQNCSVAKYEDDFLY